MKTILLTGATGFLGSHLLQALIKRGYSVVILKRSTSDTWRIKDIIGQTRSYNIDEEPLERIFSESNIECVIHLATLYKKIDSQDDVSEMLSANVSFPIKLLELGVRHKLKAFINTGTFFEYDCKSLPVSEQNPNKPFNFYAKTKIAFEAVLKTYSEDLKTVTLKLFSPYGEKDNNKIVPYIIRCAIGNERAELSDGFQKLDFIYVDDVVDAYLATLEYVKGSNNDYNAFNIGSGIPTSVRDLVSVVEERLGRSMQKRWAARSPADSPTIYSDISKAKAMLGWLPRTSIHEGINKTVNYYKGVDDDCK